MIEAVVEGIAIVGVVSSRATPVTTIVGLRYGKRGYYPQLW